MPFIKNLSKVQKHIASKKGKRITSLHTNSRDARALQRAAGREEKLSAKAAAREKTQLPYLERVDFFQAAIKSRSAPFTVAEIQALISQYISRDSEELTQLQSERRPGRPQSKREELLEHRRDVEEKEYASGFWVPDVTDAENMDLIRLWQGHWNALNVVRFIRVDGGGNMKESRFPPKGHS